MRAAPGLLPLLLVMAACSDGTDPAALEFAAVEARGQSACAVSLDDQLFCWGDNRRGQLGVGQGFDRLLVPTPLAGGAEFHSPSVGPSTCAIGDQGAFSWGAGSYGTLGTGATADAALPQRVRGDLEFREIATGGYVTCGVTSGGALYCWGRGAAVGVTPPPGPGGAWIACSFEEICAAEPVLVDDARSFASVTVGDRHNCAIDVDGQAWCWGTELPGTGDVPGQSALPVPVAEDLTFEQLEAGGEDLTCGITPLGKAYCWGYVVLSPPGDGGMVGWSKVQPVPVAPDFTFADLAVGARHACGVTPGGTAWCWGANSTGAIGNGTTAHAIADGEFVPVVAGSGMQFRTISAGSDFTCGRSFGGAVSCWGANGRGQLGDGTVTARLVPTLVEAP